MPETGHGEEKDSETDTDDGTGRNGKGPVHGCGDCGEEAGDVAEDIVGSGCSGGETQCDAAVAEDNDNSGRQKYSAENAAGNSDCTCSARARVLSRTSIFFIT